MNGVGGKPGWAWIFILEGLATVVAGAASFFIVQDFPDTASFYRRLSARRLFEDCRATTSFMLVVRNSRYRASYAVSKTGKRGLEVSMVAVTSSRARLVLTRATTLVGMYVGSIMPLYAFSLFLLSILHEERASVLAIGL